MPFSVWLRYSLSHPCIMRVLAHAQIGLKTRFAHFTRSTRFRDRFEQESRTLVIHACIVDLESFSKWTRTCLLCYKSGKKLGQPQVSTTFFCATAYRPRRQTSTQPTFQLDICRMQKYMLHSLNALLDRFEHDPEPSLYMCLSILE